MNNHTFINSNPQGFDSDCAVCGGKCRDSVQAEALEALREHTQTIEDYDGEKVIIQQF